jgi:hypothetical protein
MQGNYQNGGKKLDCADFDARLAELLDGAMQGQELADFRAHAEACVDCGPLFTQAQEGMKWLSMLEAVEPPANLVHNILAATSMRDATAPALAEHKDGRSWLRRAADWVSPALAPVFTAAMQPRYAMTAATAFLSISMILNFAGFRLKDLRRMDWRPSAIAQSASLQYYETTAKVTKYYENIRIVYQLQSQWERIKQNRTESQDGQQNEPQQNNDKGKRKNDPDQQRESNRNHLPEQGGVMLAMLTEEYTGNIYMHDRRTA